MMYYTLYKSYWAKTLHWFLFLKAILIVPVAMDYGFFPYTPPDPGWYHWYEVERHQLWQIFPQLLKQLIVRWEV